MIYRAVMERDRQELEILLRSPHQQDINDALLSAAYHGPDWRWVQERCLTLSYHPDPNVRWTASTCLGRLARIHRQLDLEPVLQRLTELQANAKVKSAADGALDDIRFFLNFQ